MQGEIWQTPEKEGECICGRALQVLTIPKITFYVQMFRCLSWGQCTMPKILCLPHLSKFVFCASIYVHHKSWQCQRFQVCQIVHCLNLYFVHSNNSLLYCYSIACGNVRACFLCIIQFAETPQKKDLRGSVSHRISCTLRSKLKRSYNAN